MFKQNEKIILASQSDSRKKVLDMAKIQYDLPKNLHSDEDEETFKHSVEHLKMEEYIQKISNFKALEVSKLNPNITVLSGDQACVLNGEEIRKPYTTTEAIAQLTSFAGKTFELITSLSLCKNGRVIWEYQTTASVTLRKFSMRDAENYVNIEETAEDGDSVVGVAGACRIESPYGMHMIKHVSGDAYTIMGLPIHALVDELYKQNIII